MLSSGPAFAQEAEDLQIGQTVFHTCAACHLPSGEGVPRAFPPIRNRLAAIASSPLGREYLITLLLQGMHGPITVNGVMYNGYMQGYQSIFSDGQISAVLNYVATEITDKPSPGFSMFKPDEVAKVRLKSRTDTTTPLEKRNKLRLN